MNENKMYIYKANILVSTEENLPLESEIDEAINNLFKIEKPAELVSANIVDIIGTNFGCCVKCGAWCSDPEDENYVSEFNVGCKINGKWYCDVCLPSEHPFSF